MKSRRTIIAAAVALALCASPAAQAAAPAAAPAAARTGSVYCGVTYTIGFFDLKSDFPYAITCMSSELPRGQCEPVGPDNVTSYIDNEMDTAWYIYGTANCTSTRTIIYGWEALSAGTRFRDNWVGSTYRTSCVTRSC